MATELDNYLQFHAQALNLRATRQQLLASNIANADTPGYQARDIDFSKTLQDALAGRVQPAELARTAAAHIAPGQQGSAAGAVQYRAVVQPSIDGNTVDMDVERAKFSENAVHYEANLTFINSQLKLMLAALQS